MADPRKRPPPADFPIIFVEQGRLACEAWYRAGRQTITRWLDICGKHQLIAQRARFWRFRRKIKQPRRTPHG